ncbi:PDDEXK nuclease domain-containing protein [Bacteroides ovatus]|uniref:PDDEXK nuclease domain-containing protein n=1 Tax=Bacteroides ovatus TaxID=28116 RepID=UPI002165A303|nr:PDDEXK nuclease domain-containing protein [Bacteroides ovatus]MCS3033914.1 PDDEXK nuclease domain-containing protein [Bacteroides ovatus]
MDEIIKGNNTLLPNGYTQWRKDIEQLIDTAKLHTALNVNVGTLTLYWNIGKSILQKQEQEGWGKQVIEQLSKDLISRYPDDRGYSVRNLRYMKRFASAYPDFPILQVPLAELKELPILQATLAELENEGKEFVQVPLAQISWYHHISLLPKVKDEAERAYYITETAQNGWSRDVMLLQIDNGYIHAKGHAINNFEQTLPPLQSDLARYIFKDPYNFSFIGTVALQNELDIEKSLTSKITDFLLEMGRGFAYIGRQYHISVDGDDYYIDLLMYHLKLHCYVVVELKAVEFKPEFVSKLNFYISAVDDLVKSPEDKPTIGLLLCRTKSNKKAEFSLRGITQPMGIAQYETEKLFADVASALPQIENLENSMDDLEYDK